MQLGRRGSGRRGAMLVVFVFLAGLLAGCDTTPVMLRGQITDANDGSHPAGVLVRAYSASEQTVIAETVTDAAGRYAFRESKLPVGTYRIRFSDNVWWEDADSWASADDVSVDNDGETVVEPTIVPAVGTLSGTVDSEDGPVVGARIDAISTVTSSVVVSTTSDGSGAFAFADLPTGPYRVKVSAEGLAPGYYPSSPSAAGAVVVAVRAEQAVDDVHVELTEPARLAGTVVASGTPRAGVTAVALTVGSHETHGSAVTDGEGRFEIGGLPATGYLLQLTDTDGNLGTVVAGAATPDDPNSGIVYPLSAGGRVDAGTIDIAAGGSASPAVIVAAVPETLVGMPVEIPLEAVGGAGGYTWQVTGLPDGLVLDAGASVVTGVPTAPGEATLEVVVTDARRVTASTQLALDVRPGMPEGCVVEDCALTDIGAETVELAAGTVISVERDGDGALTTLTLSAAAPAVNVGQFLVVPPGEHVPDGVIVEVISAEATANAQVVGIVGADLTDAYESALIKSSAATVTLVDETEHVEAGAPVPGSPAFTWSEGMDVTGGTAAASTGTPCDLEAEVDVGPDVDIDVDPYVSVLFGRNLFGFGNIFVGSGGLKMIHAQLDAELTVALSGSIAGSVACDIDVPDAVARIPLGHAGFASFRLAPELGLSATAAASVDAQVRLHCSMAYHWDEGRTSQHQWCRPITSSPTISGLGAELTVGGSITATATYNELVGLSGEIEAELRGRYQPRSIPRGELAARATATLSACGFCLFGGDAPSFTLADGVLYGESLAGGGTGYRAFATWGYEAVEPPVDPPPGTGCADLADTIWYGTMVWPDGSETSADWSAHFDGNGLLTSFFGLGVQDVSVDCDSISFNVLGIAEYSGTFDATLDEVSGTWGFGGGSSDGTWSGRRDIGPTCPALANTTWEGTWQADSLGGTWRGTFDAEGEMNSMEVTETSLGVTLTENPSDGEIDCQAISFTSVGWTWSGSFNSGLTSVSGTIAGSSSGSWSGSRV